MGMSFALGIDIGGTKIAAAVVSESGELQNHTSFPTRAVEGSEVILRRLVDLSRTLIAKAPQPLSAVGVACAGQVDTLRGVIVSATALLPGWSGLPLREYLESHLNLPVVVDNDVKAMGLAEVRLGAGRGERDVLCVAAGTGIGGAIFINGEVYRGANGFAGEIGHLPIVINGRQCTCGGRGCVEAYTGGPAIAYEFALRAGEAQLQDWLNKSSSQITVEDIVSCLVSNKQQARDCARQVIEMSGKLLGRALGGLVNAINPALIILGGGVTHGVGEMFVEAVRHGVMQTALPPMRRVKVVPATLGITAGIIGAGLLAMER